MKPYGDSDEERESQKRLRVNQLHSLLLKQPQDATKCSPSKRIFRPKKDKGEAKSSLPAVQGLVPIFHKDSEYIQHLEEEVKFCKEELLEMKQRIRVVVVENEKLHQQLKTKLEEETLKDYTILDGTTSLSPTGQLPPHEAPCLQNIFSETFTRLRTIDGDELEKLKEINQAQLKTLESQVISLKKDLATSQKECEEVKVRLRHKEMMAAVGSEQRVGGLCLKCAQHEAVLAGTHCNVPIQAITKERDELSVMLQSLRTCLHEAEQREWAASQQVKQAMVVAEEANLEKTRAEVLCEQAHRELARQRERRQEEMNAQQKKILQARHAEREEAKKEKEELAQSMRGLTQRVGELDALVAQADREKSSLTGQLQEAYRKLTTQEEEGNKICGELRYLLSQAQLKRSEAERELRDFSSRNARQLELAEQEVEKLGAELSVCRQRLEEAQKATSRAQAEAVGLEERLGRAEHQLHLTRQEREKWERCRREDVAALTFQAQQRELHLAEKLQQMESQHEQRVGEADALLSSQNSLIGKLNVEGRHLLEELETSRAKVNQLDQQRSQLQESVEKLRIRCLEMDEECVQHGRMHQRMKSRLQQLDQHSQASGEQIVELLRRQTQLMEERAALLEEARTLRVQTPGSGQPVI
uniref:Serologically defined colon cancer antigen 8 n=1 Tax=Denticeps clupeoides TaxID=299321 RepID=A0AAY4DLF3_9TELE